LQGNNFKPSMSAQGQVTPFGNRSVNGRSGSIQAVSGLSAGRLVRVESGPPPDTPATDKQMRYAVAHAWRGRAISGRNAYAVQGSLCHAGGSRGMDIAHCKCRGTKRDGDQRSHTAPRLENEPPPKLIVDPPLAAALPHGIVLIQYRVENVRIVSVFGTGALNVSPRVGHLHIHVDDLPWLWADFSNVNTIDLAGMPPGQHKVLIELVNANHQMFPGCTMCSRMVTFTVPENQSSPH
jgi:hypothetical protein